jgi:hypothetical protein
MRLSADHGYGNVSLHPWPVVATSFARLKFLNLEPAPIFLDTNLG